jgi:hypothetical protein
MKIIMKMKREMLSRQLQGHVQAAMRAFGNRDTDTLLSLNCCFCALLCTLGRSYFRNSRWLGSSLSAHYDDQFFAEERIYALHTSPEE